MAKLIDIPTVHEPSGDLSFLQHPLIGGEVLQVAVHAHSSGYEITSNHELIIPLRGEICVSIIDQDLHFSLNSPAQALILEAGTCRKVVVQPHSLRLHVAVTLHE